MRTVTAPAFLLFDRKNLADAGFKVAQDKASMSEYGFASMAVL